VARKAATRATRGRKAVERWQGTVIVDVIFEDGLLFLAVENIRSSQSIAYANTKEPHPILATSVPNPQGLDWLRRASVTRVPKQERPTELRSGGRPRGARGAAFPHIAGHTKETNHGIAHRR
jgi:hypothetical protein